MRRDLTSGQWRVPTDLTGSDDWANGVVVMGGIGGKTLIADCRGNVPRDEQVGNARMIAAIPDFLELLHECERYLGDQPSSDRSAMQLHRRVVAVINRPSGAWSGGRAR